MSNKKQTAVEWLVEQSKKQEWFTLEQETYIDQAMQMEKEQSKKDYDSGLYDGTMDEVKDRLYKNAEQYYNETYEK